MAVIEATINLDMLNMGEQVEVPAAMLKEAPIKGLLDIGYLKVVKGDDVQGDVPAADEAGFTDEVTTTEAAEETPQAKRQRAATNKAD
jgi:hypothetical protein